MAGHRRRRELGEPVWQGACVAAAELETRGEAAGGRSSSSGAMRPAAELEKAWTGGGRAARALTGDMLKMQGRATPAAGDGRQRGWTAVAKGEKEMLELGGIL